MITGLPSTRPSRGEGLPRTSVARLAACAAAACVMFAATHALADTLLPVGPPVYDAALAASTVTTAGDTRIAHANSLLAQGSYIQARALLRDVLAADPANVAALVALARVEDHLGHDLMSRALLDEALAIAPSDAGVVALDAESRDRHFTTADAEYQFAWGNGNTWHQGGIEPAWQASPSARYGVFAEHYVLSDSSSSATANRIGVSAVLGDIDALEVRARLLNSSFGGYPDRLDGAIDVSGSVKHMRYLASYAITGIDGAPSAQDDLVNPAGANLRVENLIGEAGWASKYTSAYVKGRLSYISDGNTYHFAEIGALQDLGFVPVDIQLGAFANDSGYAFVYPLALAGYYSYNYQNQIALKAIVRCAFGRHFDASAAGDIGTVNTKIPHWAYNPQSYQQFSPELRYTNRSLELAADGSFSQVLGGVNVLNYESNQVTLALRFRL